MEYDRGYCECCCEEDAGLVREVINLRCSPEAPIGHGPIYKHKKIEISKCKRCHDSWLLISQWDFREVEDYWNSIDPVEIEESLYPEQYKFVPQDRKIWKKVKFKDLLKGSDIFENFGDDAGEELYKLKVKVDGIFLNCGNCGRKLPHENITPDPYIHWIGKESVNPSGYIILRCTGCNKIRYVEITPYRKVKSRESDKDDKNHSGKKKKVRIFILRYFGDEDEIKNFPVGYELPEPINSLWESINAREVNPLLTIGEKLLMWAGLRMIWEFSAHLKLKDIVRNYFDIWKGGEKIHKLLEEYPFDDEIIEQKKNLIIKYANMTIHELRNVDDDEFESSLKNTEQFLERLFSNEWRIYLDEPWPIE